MLIKKSHLNYQLYVEKTDDSNPSEVIFTGTDQSKILGAVYKVEKGNIVTLPYLNHNYYKQFDYGTDDAKKFDLFTVVKYLDENEDELFKQACRQAIFDGRGKQVKFPEIPAMTSRIFGFAP